MPGSHAELPQNTVHIRFHSAFRNNEVIGNLRIRAALGYRLEHLLLTVGQL